MHLLPVCAESHDRLQAAASGVVRTARTESWYRTQARTVTDAVPLTDPLRPYVSLMPRGGWEGDRVDAGAAVAGRELDASALMTPASTTPLVWPRLLAAVTASAVVSSGSRGPASTSPTQLMPPAVYLEVMAAAVAAHPDLLPRGAPTAAVVAAMANWLSRPRGLPLDVAVAALRLLLVLCDVAVSCGGLAQSSATWAGGISVEEHGGAATVWRLPAAGTYAVTVAVDDELTTALLPQALAFADSQDETHASAQAQVHVPVERVRDSAADEPPEGPMPSASEDGE